MVGQEFCSFGVLPCEAALGSGSNPRTRASSGDRRCVGGSALYSAGRSSHFAGRAASHTSGTPPGLPHWPFALITPLAIFGIRASVRVAASCAVWLGLNGIRTICTASSAAHERAPTVGASPRPRWPVEAGRTPAGKQVRGHEGSA